MPQAQSGRPAVFMDRDGCLIEEMGYLNHPSRVRILPRTAAAVARLNAAGIPALMATNQAGIARGYFSAETLAEINAEVVRQLGVGRRPPRWALRLHPPPDGGQPAVPPALRLPKAEAGAPPARARKSSAWTCHAR